MLYFLLSLFICGEDQILKNKIDKNTGTGQETQCWNGRIIKTKAYNKGAFLNFLDKNPKALKGISLFLMSTLFLIYIPTLLSKGKHALKLGLSFIIGGALSNVYDRLKRGYVIDYFKVREIKNVVFNIGDVFIFLGGIIVLVREIFKKD